MMRRSPLATLAFFIFLAAFASPYVVSLLEITHIDINFEQIAKIYSSSLGQAFMSAVVTMLFGLYGALGLFWLKDKISPARYAMFEFVILLPGLLPGLFVVVSFLNVLPYFPFGFWGVVLLHACAEAGMAALILRRILHHRLSPYFDSAELMGCSRSYFLRTCWRLVAPAAVPVFFIFFLFFLSSVSIPLILAGGKGASLEAAIYEKIVMAHDWNQALNLFLVQAVFMVIGFCLVDFFPSASWRDPQGSSARFLNAPLGWVIVAAPAVVILISLITKIPSGVQGLVRQPEVMHGWRSYFAGSLITGFVSGGLVFAGLTLLSYFYPRFKKFFSLLVTPSFVILAFAFVLLPGVSRTAMLWKIAAALAVGFLPTLLRLGLVQKLDSLQEQMDSVAVLGARPLKIFVQGVFPQILPQLSLMSGLAAVWTMGDFAMSRVIAGGDITLAMWVQSLVDQYRWDMALVLSWLILLTSFGVFGFFWSLSYVSHQKLNENV